MSDQIAEVARQLRENVPAINSKTKKAQAAIADVIIDNESSYMATDVDGDLILTANTLANPEMVIINYSSSTIVELRNKMTLVDASRLIAAETMNHDLGIIRCDELQAFVLRGDLPREIHSKMTDAGVPADLLARSKAIAAAASLVAEKVGWAHQAFIAKARLKHTPPKVVSVAPEVAGASTLSPQHLAASVVCAYCGVESEKLSRCGRCLNAYYCDVSCQKKAWQASHKNECKSAAK
jgi:hypothetical protein